MVDYTKILSRKYKAEWTINGDDYSGLTWLSDTPKPTKKQLDDLWVEVTSEIQEEENAKTNAKSALLAKLGITADEAKLLLS